jgi:hypothetical protein
MLRINGGVTVEKFVMEINSWATRILDNHHKDDAQGLFAEMSCYRLAGRRVCIEVWTTPIISSHDTLSESWEISVCIAGWSDIIRIKQISRQEGVRPKGLAPALPLFAQDRLPCSAWSQGLCSKGNSSV